MSGTVLITPRSLSAGGDVALRELERAGYILRYGPPGRTPTEAELLALLPGCVGWIAGVEPVTDEVVRAAAPSLKVISRNGVGTDNLPLHTCESLGIEVRRADGANAQGVAELSIALIFAAIRQLPYVDARLKQGQWVRRAGSELRGSTVGIVGFGAVGRKVAAMAASLGARVLVHDPFAPASAMERDIERVDLDDLIARARIVTLHCPPATSGKPVLDRQMLESMIDGACLINTARASLVDEQALLAALGGNRLACYATDVFDSEPPGLTELVASDRVIATPHIGGFTVESVAKATTVAVSNLLESLRARTDVDLAS